MLRRFPLGYWVLTAVLAGGALANAGPAHAEAAHRIDVLVVYSGSAEDQMQRIVQWGRSWGETEMGPFLEANFERVSQIYQQSGVDVDLNVVHHQQIDLSYIDAQNWQSTLSYALMASEDLNANFIPYVDAIDAIRDVHVADIVVYWRGFQDGGPTSNGAGSVGGGEDEAYVHLTYGGITPSMAAHETGHLLGGQHSDGLQGSATFSIDGDTATFREYRTVMTVAYPLDLPDYRYIWRFSADGTSVSGDIDCSQFTGPLSTCGFASTSPLGDASHDAAAVVGAMVPVVAAFRSAPAVVPVAGPIVQGLLVLLMGGAGLAVLARRRK
ncbi:MAG: zinc-dependent metalloprotease family protein [Myxococcota bacterium]